MSVSGPLAAARYHDMMVATCLDQWFQYFQIGLPLLSEEALRNANGIASTEAEVVRRRERRYRQHGRNVKEDVPRLGILDVAEDD